MCQTCFFSSLSMKEIVFSSMVYSWQVKVSIIPSLVGSFIFILYNFNSTPVRFSSALRTSICNIRFLLFIRLCFEIRTKKGIRYSYWACSLVELNGSSLKSVFPLILSIQSQFVYFQNTDFPIFSPLRYISFGCMVYHPGTSFFMASFSWNSL